MFQMKEQDKAPEEELNEGELDNQPKKEFRVMIVKMIKEFRRIDALREISFLTKSKKIKELPEKKNT